jgi:general secretion pathway protein H
MRSLYPDRSNLFAGPRGFTLVELLVVITIMGTLAMLAAPRVGNSLINLQLKTSARALAASLRYAGSRAVTDKIMYQAIIDKGQGVVTVRPLYQVRAEEENAEEPSNTGRTLKKEYGLPEGIQFHEVKTGKGRHDPAERYFIYFLENGTSTGGEIALVNTRGKSCVVEVDIVTSRAKIF